MLISPVPDMAEECYYNDAQVIVYNDLTATQMDPKLNFEKSETFEEDDSQNYYFEFLKTKIMPHTSTQKPLHEKPLIYQQYSGSTPSATTSNATKKFTYKSATTNSGIIYSPGAARPNNSTNSTIKSMVSEPPVYKSSVSNIVCSKCENNEKLILANTELLKTVLKELKYLRREQQHYITHNTESPTIPQINLNLPAETVEQFKSIEENSKSDDFEKALIRKFKSIDDPNLDKYVRACLKSLMNDAVACSFIWFGQNNNIPIKSYNTMNLIKETTKNRFPAARTHEIVYLIKPWFQYAKDRNRRSNKRS